MKFRYIPILNWKQGERAALHRLTPTGRKDVIPLMILGADRYVSKKGTKSRPAMPPANVVVHELTQIWGNTPIFVDAAAIPAYPGLPHPLQDIGREARAAGLHIIPSTTLSAPSPYQAAVAALCSTDRFGVGLRVDIQGFTSAATWSGAWPHGPEQTDLILDLTSGVGPVNALGSAIHPAFTGLHVGSKWRSVTLAGSSMPENFSGFASGLHTIQRLEWILWQRIASLSLPYSLHYGDYATVATLPAPAGIAWGFPINAKYTTDADFLICRGERTTGLGGVDMDQQLLGHARNIVKYPHRNLLPHCWADGKINRIAAAAEPPGGLPGWVIISVNRHIELVRHILS